MLTCLYTCSLGAWGTVYLDLFNCGAWGYLLCCYTFVVKCVFIVDCSEALLGHHCDVGKKGVDVVLPINGDWPVWGYRLWGLACMGLQRGIGLCGALVY